MDFTKIHEELLRYGEIVSDWEEMEVKEGRDNFWRIRIIEHAYHRYLDIMYNGKVKEITELHDIKEFYTLN